MLFMLGCICELTNLAFCKHVVTSSGKLSVAIGCVVLELVSHESGGIVAAMVR